MQVLRHRARAVHHEVAVRELLVDLLDAVHRQHFAGGLARELVGAVAGAHRDGERVDAGAGHEVDRLIGIGEQLIERQLALGAVAVFFFAGAALERAEAAELALDRNAEAVRDVDHLAGDRDVVLVARRRLAVVLERAVHHDAGEAHADRADARVGSVAVVLVHHDGDLGIELRRGQHQVAQEEVVGVLAGAARGLDDDRALGGAGGLHDRLDLLHVVDVEGAHAVAVFGGVIEQWTKRDEGHFLTPSRCVVGSARATKTFAA